MTKTAALAAARAQLRFGYFHATDSADYSVACSKCRGSVVTQRNYRYRPARKGEPYSDVQDGKRVVYDQESERQALLRALVAHLLEGCSRERR
jgi:hypothetical protein